MKNPLKPNHEQGNSSPAPIYFFDLDHTLIRCNSSARFGVYLFAKGLAGFPKMSFLLLLYMLHKWKVVSLSRLHLWSFSLLFRGKSKEKISTLFQEQLDQEFSQQKNPELVRKLEEALIHGDVYLVSSSPDFIVEHYARRFKVTGWCATEYSVNDAGEFDKLGMIVDGNAKWKFAQGLIQGRVSYAYSDDHADDPLLKNVTYGTLV